MRLSPNFTLDELTFSEIAQRKGIPNKPNVQQIEALRVLCMNILQPVRDHFKLPVSVSSGFRTIGLCLAIGSSAKSQHTRGEAADFEIFGVHNKDVSDWIVKNLDYDQCILEFWDPKDPNSGWIHCSYTLERMNRKEYLWANKENGKIVYTPII